MRNPQSKQNAIYLKCGELKSMQMQWKHGSQQKQAKREQARHETGKKQNEEK